jgi:hypothetical protein
MWGVESLERNRERRLASHQNEPAYSAGMSFTYQRHIYVG